MSRIARRMPHRSLWVALVVSLVLVASGLRVYRRLYRDRLDETTGMATTTTTTIANSDAKTLRKWTKDSPEFNSHCGNYLKTYYTCNHRGGTADEDATSPQLNAGDVVLSVDILNNWHWCPSALARMRKLDGPLNAFLDRARASGALVIHAVSDSKTHYFEHPTLRGADIRLDTDAPFRVPYLVPYDTTSPENSKLSAEAVADARELLEWRALSRDKLTALEPPRGLTLKVDMACGENGKSLFGNGNRRPRDMPGLNASYVKRGDIVSAGRHAIFSAIRQRWSSTPAQRSKRRILFVGVHLDLCILYSRWFALLRVARWGLEKLEPGKIELGVVANLADVSSYPSNELDFAIVDDTACWIKCAVDPRLLADLPNVETSLYSYA